MALVRSRGVRNYADADITVAIAEAAKTVDGSLIQTRYNRWRALEVNGWAPAVQTAVKRFGSWNEALRAAGVEPLAPRNGRSRRMAMPAPCHNGGGAGVESKSGRLARLARRGACEPTPGRGRAGTRRDLSRRGRVGLCGERILRALYVEARLSIDAAACVVGVGFRAVPPGRCSPVGSRAGLSWLKTRSLRGGPAAAQMSPATRAVW